MDNVQNQDADPKENLQEEQELLKDSPVDAVKREVVEKYGLDESIDGELIDKLAEGEIQHRKKLATAIRQKINYREQLGQKDQKPEVKPPVVPQVSIKPEEIASLVKQQVDEQLGEEKLNRESISEESKIEVKRYAKASGMSISQVLNSEYFRFLKGQDEAKNRVNEASVGSKRKAPTRNDFASMNPNDFDMTTEEGREQYEKFKEWRKKNS